MLVLTRKVGERIRLLVDGKECWITVTHVFDRKAQIGIDAPHEIRIAREEVIKNGRE